MIIQKKIAERHISRVSKTLHSILVLHYHVNLTRWILHIHVPTTSILVLVYKNDESYLKNLHKYFKKGFFRYMFYCLITFVDLILYILKPVVLGHFKVRVINLIFWCICSNFNTFGTKVLLSSTLHLRKHHLCKNKSTDFATR